LTVLVWILLILLVGIGLGFIAMPLVRARGGGSPGQADERREALREKEGALQLLRDLEQDHRTGKLEPEDYAVLRPEAEARAIAAMKRCDGLAAETGADVEDPIERAIRLERVRLERGASR